MSPSRLLALGVSALVVLVYLWRAAVGIPAGFAKARGQQLVFHGAFAQAIDEFDRGAVGAERASSLRKAADARIITWDAQVEERGLAVADETLLRDAARDYALALCESPASWTPWQGLSRIYERIEEAPWEVSGEPPPIVPGDPWRGVGTAGRLAVGLLLEARARAPNWFAIHDVLALRYGRYGMEDEALATVRESARVLPVFSRHGYRMMPELPPPVLDAFSEGAWEALDATPVLARLEQLIALGRLEELRGDFAKARRALELALAEPAEPVSRAETHYLLGRVLRGAGELELARAELEQAAEHPTFEDAALTGLASLAEELDRPEQSIELLRRLRWKDPANLDVLLRFADAARRGEDWPSALEALNWARVKHPQDPRPWAALLETRLAMDDVAAATSLLRELRQDPPEGLDLERLERLIDAATSRREMRPPEGDQL